MLYVFFQTDSDCNNIDGILLADIGSPKGLLWVKPDILKCNEIRISPVKPTMEYGNANYAGRNPQDNFREKKAFIDIDK